MIEKENPSETEQLDTQQAFLDMYEEYNRLMYWAAGNYTESPELREDFMQEGIKRLIPKTEGMRSFKSRGLASYLVTTIRNISFNHYRRASLESKYFVDEDVSAFEEDGLIVDRNSGERPVEDAALMRVQAEELKKILVRLSETEQILLRGRYQLYLSDKELSEQLQCNPDSIRMMLTRARRHALALLTEEGFEYETT